MKIIDFRSFSMYVTICNPFIPRDRTVWIIANGFFKGKGTIQPPQIHDDLKKL